MTAVLLVAVVLGACSPVATVNRHGIEALLIDEASGEPIRRSPVTVCVDDERFTRRTDGEGGIRVAPHREWHWSWLGGPAWLSDPETEVEIRCEGFKPVAFRWARYLGRDEAFPEEGGVIRMGAVRIERW